MSNRKHNFDIFREEAMNAVEGWLGEKAVDALELVDRYQHERGIKGDALEIGVFQGRFFLALMAALSDDEKAIAADIFDDQSLNIDLSGNGVETLRIFNENVARYARNPAALRTVVGDSMVLRPAQVLGHSAHGGFRLVSIDGGHTAEHVMNDLGLAADIIVSGGAIFIDDFHSSHWPGVYEGYVRYMLHANKNLAPVFFVDNKLIMTTIAHQPQMVDFFRHNVVVPEWKYLANVSSCGFKYIASN